MSVLSFSQDRAFDAVIFDLDGTLVDSLPGIEYSLHQAVMEALPGALLPPAQTLIGPPVREMFRRALPGVSEPALGELERAFRRSYDQTGYLETIAYDGVPKLLSLLTRSGIKLYIVTNKPPEATRQTLAHLELNKVFACVVSTGDWLPAKITKAEATTWLLEQERLDSARCAFVGDSPDDAAAAHSNHIMFFAAAYGYGRVVAVPGDVTLTAPDALAEFVLRQSPVAAS